MNEPGSGLEKTLEKLLRRIVREEIRAALSEDERKTQNVKPYFTIKEAADFSRLAPSTIRLYIRQRKLPARKKFRTLRGLLGLSQTKLAKELGVTLRTVARWERGEYPIPRLAELALRNLFRESLKETIPWEKIKKELKL